eukprot:7090689-Pyramimonas_sp.AAC.1
MYLLLVLFLLLRILRVRAVVPPILRILRVLSCQVAPAASLLHGRQDCLMLLLPPRAPLSNARAPIGCLETHPIPFRTARAHNTKQRFRG